MTNSLILFVRNLQHGRVKSRIAREKGAETAYLVYEQLLYNLKNSITKNEVDGAIEVCYSDYIDDSDKWPFPVEKTLQKGNDLGERMFNAVSRKLKIKSKVILVGSDIPDLSMKQIEEGFRLLDKYDVVIGPTFDGGYYLLGMSENHPYLFNNIEWSTNHVFSDSVQLINNHNNTYSELQKLLDVDKWNDVPKDMRNRINKKK